MCLPVCVAAGYNVLTKPFLKINAVIQELGNPLKFLGFVILGKPARSRMGHAH